MEGTFDLFVSGMPKFQIASDLVRVCVNEGSYNLASNVISNDGSVVTYKIAGTEITGSTVQLGEFTYGPGTYSIDVISTNTF